LNVSAEEALGWVSQPHFESLIKEHLPSTDEIRNIFYLEAAKSARAIAEIRDKGAKDRDRLDAAKELLRQAGFTPIQRIASVSFSLSPKAAGNIEKAAKDMGWAVREEKNGNEG